jgi:prepilin-type N-terminal cleavage/methylation domain-containing protein
MNLRLKGIKVKKYFKNKTKQGFSLLEMLVSLGIISIMLVLLSNVLIISLKISARSSARGLVREEISDLLSIVRKDIRNADYVQSCSGTLSSGGTPTCTMFTGTAVVWTVCPKVSPTPTSTGGSTSAMDICKKDAAGNIIERSPGNLNITEFSFEEGFSESENTKVILVTIIASHSNSSLSVANIVQQTSITTRNYGTDNIAKLLSLPTIPTPLPSNISPTPTPTPTTPPACGGGLYCSAGSLTGGSACMSGSQLIYCCPSGYLLSGSTCIVAPPACGSGLYCSSSAVTGGSACTSGSTVVYCCPSGNILSGSKCTIPPISEDPITLANWNIYNSGSTGSWTIVTDATRGTSLQAKLSGAGTTVLWRKFTVNPNTAVNGQFNLKATSYPAGTYGFYHAGYLGDLGTTNPGASYASNAAGWGYNSGFVGFTNSFQACLNSWCGPYGINFSTGSNTVVYIAFKLTCSSGCGQTMLIDPFTFSQN